MEACLGGRALTQMLNEEDVRVVDWDAPREVERRGIDFSTDAQQVVVTLVAMGAPAAIKAAVEKFHKRVPPGERRDPRRGNG
jgi:hypothetical protein